MHLRSTGPLFVLALCACSDVADIEDESRHGPVVTIADWFTSCHLLRSETSVVLFDACFRSGTLEDGLDREGLEAEDVTHVLLTHGHGDHVGGLEILEHAEVWALPGERETLADTTEPVVSIDRELVDGERLMFDSHIVDVLAMPGHTPGSAAYRVGGAVILGDAALINGDGALEPVPESRSEDPEAAVDALVALHARLQPEAESVQWLVPAHSGAARGMDSLTDFVARIAAGSNRTNYP